MGSFDIGSAAQFLKGYLGAQEKRVKTQEEKDKRNKDAEKVSKIITDAKERGDFITWTVDPQTGGQKAVIKSKAEAEQEQKAKLQQVQAQQQQKQQQAAIGQIQKLQAQAAGQGRELNVNPSLQPGRQAEVARQLTNAKSIEDNTPTQKVIKNITADMTKVKELLKEFLKDYKEDPEFFKNQGIDIEIIKKRFGVQ